MIEKLRRNDVGTLDFDAKFPGMRKPQEFIIYPIGSDDDGKVLKIQSDTRIGLIDLTTGEIRLTPSIKGGAYSPHLRLATHIVTLSAEQLLVLKAQVASTSNPQGGSSVLKVDNGGAINVLGKQ